MVRETSIKTFNEITESGLLGRMQLRVLNVIKMYPKNCDRIYAQISHLNINQVTGRRNELVATGCVKDAGVIMDMETGRNVHIWEVPKQIHFRPRLKQDKQRRLNSFLFSED
jgi:hypothetical protein